MLVQISTQIATDLNASTALLLLLDASSVSALISEQEDGDSFVNYYVKYDGSLSKDDAKQWQVSVESWSNTYDKSITIADEVTTALEASVNRYDYVSSESMPIHYEGKNIIVTKQIFNIKQ